MNNKEYGPVFNQTFLIEIAKVQQEILKVH